MLAFNFKKFETLALQRLPEILAEKMDSCDPTNASKIREAVTVLLLEYAQQENSRLPQKEAEDLAKDMVDLFDFYYEFYVREKESMVSEEDLKMQHECVKALSAPETILTYRQYYGLYGKGTTKTSRCKKVFEYMQTHKMMKFDWKTEAISLDGKNLGKFAKLPMAKRRKTKFEELEKVKEGDFDYLFLTNDNVRVYFGQVFTKCLELYHQSINQTFQGIQATRFHIISNRFNVPDSEPLSEGSLMPDCYRRVLEEDRKRQEEEKENEKDNKNRKRKANRDIRSSDFDEVPMFEVDNRSDNDPDFFGSIPDDELSEDYTLVADNYESGYVGLNNVCSSPIAENLFEEKEQDEETPIEEISNDHLPHVSVGPFLEFLKKGYKTLFASEVSFIIYYITIQGLLS